ncbi:transcriptional repressor NrdR [candidate division SR1 bacterium]|nr:transcriptional repressor NrdR [candidate division SR1 bacterium]
MRCGKCKNADTKVIDSRIVDNGQTIRRRRECEFCGFRFTTFERIGVTDLMVVKKDGSKEMYDRGKLKRAIMLAFAKMDDTSNEKIEEMLNILESTWQIQSNEISSHQIGDDVLNILKEEFPVPYVRFASVYKSFTGLKDFQKFIS